MSRPVPAVSHARAQLAARFPGLRPAQQAGLALWVGGAVLAGSGTEPAVLAALVGEGLAAAATRARRREVLRDGADKAAPCATQLEPAACFGPLLAWVADLWTGDTLPLALDATARGDRVVLSLSVLYRGSAVPVAWAVRPERGRGAWLPHLTGLLAAVAGAVPAGLAVLVLADRGLWSPALWAAIRSHGWHPLLRVRPDATFAPAGGRRLAARRLVRGPGEGWVGAGTAFKHRAARLPATLVVHWAPGQAEPWLLLTDLPPERVEGAWYGLRGWVELGFRAFKSFGWHWERTRRADPARVARHWLALAVATLLGLAAGTRLEDAARRGVPLGRLRRPRGAVPARARERAVLARGREWLHRQALRGRPWLRAWWLAPERLPAAPPGLAITRHRPPVAGAAA